MPQPIIHGHSVNGKFSPTYNAWKHMLDRCRLKTHKQWSNYGGRGITVCQRWENFVNFLADMGCRPDGLSLERTDNSKGYSPSNCRWATQREQMRNMRKNRVFTIDGVTACLASQAERFKINNRTVTRRLNFGWPMEEAFKLPLLPKGYHYHRSLQRK
jgi:hypothetical protein